MSESQRQGSATTAETNTLSDFEVLLGRPATERDKAMATRLDRYAERVERLLPDRLRGMGERFVRRALLTWAGNQNLQSCSESSIVRCVLEAAEDGLSIDGKLAHAVPYDGVATYQPDYKGIVAVARANGAILGCLADAHREGDTLTSWIGDDGERHLEFRKAIPPKTDAKTLGYFSVLRMPDGTRDHAYMTVEEINAIRDRTRAWRAFKAGKIRNTPWASDYGEMAKKTVIKRAMKLYCNDERVQSVLSRDDREFTTPVPSQREMPSMAEIVGARDDFPADDAESSVPPAAQATTEAVPEPENGQHAEPDGEVEALWSRVYAELHSAGSAAEVDAVLDRCPARLETDNKARFGRLLDQAEVRKQELADA